MKKYQVGSKLLGLKNSKDNDFVVLCEDLVLTKRVIENGEEIFYKTKKELMYTLTFKLINNSNTLFNYQYDRDIIGEDFPVEYHLLDYKNELILYLNKIVDSKLFNFNKLITCNNGNCSPKIYHIAYIVFIIKNNSPIITEEQKEIIQKIHDANMPISYLDELTKMIKEV